MSHIDEYEVAFVVVSESPKTDIPQCTPSARLPASQYGTRSGSSASTNVPSDISRDIDALAMIDRPPTTAAPATGTVAVAAPAPNADTDANTNADADANAAPSSPPLP